MRIELLRSDVASLKVDAIVNPRLAHAGDGVDPYASPAEVTTGNLLCRFVIQAILPPPGADGAEHHLHVATWSALQRAEGLAIESVAFPPCHTMAGLPAFLCARAMMGAALDFGPHAHSLRYVVFCAFNETSYVALQRALQELQH